MFAEHAYYGSDKMLLFATKFFSTAFILVADFLFVRFWYIVTEYIKAYTTSILAASTFLRRLPWPHDIAYTHG